ncbi:hypothetical protein ACS0TY_018981 [Phlomoides rotata]
MPSFSVEDEDGSENLGVKSSDGPIIGEGGALGWSTWLEKEEEQRQRIVREDVMGICS